jgi:hypothetical protein
MDERIESIARDGGELLGDYVADLTASSVKFVDTLLRNVSRLVEGVISEGAEVVRSATSVLVDEEERSPEV